MRIVIDARKAADFGIGTYIRRLGAACARLAPGDEFVFLGQPDQLRGDSPPPVGMGDGEVPLPRGDNIRWEPNLSATYSLRELFSVSWQARKVGADVFHAPHYVYPFFVPCPGVVTIHDCIHLRFPGQLPNAWASLYARLMLRRAVRAADRVLAVSQATKADLVELVNADPARIDVIPHGCDPYFLAEVPADELEATRKRHHLDRPFLLCVTNIKPHKNVRRLIEAFSRLAGVYAQLELVIAGGRLEEHPELDRRRRELGLEHRVRSLGFVPKREVRALYRMAEVFVFPSLYEGFGLPPLEAMASGAAVVSSRSSSLPEVIERAGLLVNPFRVDAIAEAIRTLLDNDNFRRALGMQGRRRALTFDWDESARRVLGIYHGIAGR